MPIRFHRWTFELIGLVLLVFAFVSEGFPGSADAMNHFLISQRAFEHPELFLDQWNKPLFTLISAPFAQFGFTWVRVMNVLIGLITALLLYQTARKDAPKLAIVIPFILLGMPQYTQILPSAMTEPLFGLLMAGAILALRSHRVWLAMILIGLSPFARQEGYILIPFAVLFLTLSNRWKLIPLLASGAVIFGLLAFFILGDPLYLINSFPYGSGASDIYGHGEWNHFIKQIDVLFGVPNTILLCLGTVLFLIGTFRTGLKEQLRDAKTSALYFSFLVVALFLVGHSYLWATGSGGSVGLIRVLASAAPAAAFIAFQGIAAVVGLSILQKPWLKGIVATAIVGVIVVYLPTAIAIPFPQTTTEEVLQDVSEWCADYDFGEGKIYYSDPSIYFFADGKSTLDHPADRPMIDGNNVSTTLQAEDHVIWDAHFSPNEGRLPYDSLAMNPYLRIIKRFSPREAFNVLGGYPYEIVVFRMTDVKVQKVKRTQVRKTESFELFPEDPSRVIIDPVEGDKCLMADPDHQYSTLRDTINGNEKRTITKLLASGKVYWAGNDPKPKFSLVASIGKDGENYHYSASQSEDMELTPDSWNTISHEFALPASMPDDAELGVYIWFREGKQILVDDLLLKEEVVEEWNPDQLNTTRLDTVPREVESRME